jgi:F0F1-type ATP synthase membrane subunit b/b'
MKRVARLALMLCLAAVLAFAAEGKEGGEDSLKVWEWANFVLLASGLGYLMAKLLPPVFASRSQAIVQDMTESEKIRRDADARAAEVERRLAGLEAEIAALRVDSQKESKVETERLASHTAAEIAKIRTQSEREIATAAKAARADLQRYAAGLAVNLAEQKIRARMNPTTQDNLVRSFVRELR